MFASANSVQYAKSPKYAQHRTVFQQEILDFYVNIRCLAPVCILSSHKSLFSHLNQGNPPEICQSISLAGLGVMIAGYALFALLNLRLPKMTQPAWGYAFGFLGGLLGGAYNTSGPPVIVYGNCLRWEPDEFKSNLQGFFLIASFAIAIGHALNRNLTPDVWHYFLISIPAIVIGIWAGTSLDKYLNPDNFRKIVLVLLIVMGIRLIFA